MRHDGFERLRRKSCEYDEKSCHSFPDLHGWFLMNACEICDNPDAIAAGTTGRASRRRELRCRVRSEGSERAFPRAIP